MLHTHEDASARARARLELALPPDAMVVVWSPRATWAAAAPVADTLRTIGRADRMVLLVPRGWGETELAPNRALAQRSAGIALLEGIDPALALDSCDALVSDDDALLYGAAWRGRGVVRLGEVSAGEDPFELGPCIASIEELPDALERVLPGEIYDKRFAAARARLLASAAQTAPEPSAAEPQFDQFEAPPSPLAAASELAEIEALAAFGDRDGAFARVRAKLVEAPSSELYCTLASLERQAARLDAAEAAVRSAENLARRALAKALCEGARVMVDRGEFESAQLRFEEATRIDATFGDPLVGLGSLSLHRGAPDEGERHFRAALERERSVKALSGLGLALVSANRSREALEPLEAALDREADALPAVYGLVHACFQTGELVRAERRVRACVELRAGNLDLHFTLAGLRYQLGDHAGSREALERIEIFKPDYPGLAELRAKLDG